jgi:hypothetical protein
MQSPPRPVSFTCSWCYKDVTENRKPGPTPKYCLTCIVEVRRVAAATRAKRYRERLAEQDTTPWWEKRPPGRPQKG